MGKVTKEPKLKLGGSSSAERDGGHKSVRERERHYRNDEHGGRLDRKRDHGGAKISEHRVQHIGRDRSRDRAGQNHYNERRGGDAYEWGKRSPGDANDKKRQLEVNPKDNEPPAKKDKINFGLSGALTEDANKVNGVVIKYAEPPEARRPKRHWRLYQFKGETALPILHIHRQSCFLVGRDRTVADFPVYHPSCSNQHAAFQYRQVPFQREDGSQGKRVRLYIIDLESANGTFLNNQKIEARKYYELMEKDVIKFGFSSRDYVLLHENSKDDQKDDDVNVKYEPEKK